MLGQLDGWFGSQCGTAMLPCTSQVGACGLCTSVAHDKGEVARLVQEKQKSQGPTLLASLLP